MAGKYFDPEFDYSRAMEESLKDGDLRNLAHLARERELKIASDPDKYKDVRATSDFLGEYGWVLGTNPTSEDEYFAVAKARGDYVEPQYGEQSTSDLYADSLADYRAEINRLAEAQRQSRIAGLGKARDNALSGLDAEKATIDPYYYDARNQAAGASDVGAMNFAQYMAGRGIKGSAGAMPEMYRNAGLQSQIGGLDRQQAAEHSDIARRRSGIQSAYESDVAGANADIDAQTMQNYINQMQTVQAQRIADMAAQGKTSTGQLNLQGQNAQNAEYERQAALLAAQYYDDIMAEIDRRAAINPNDPLIPYLYSARRQKIQTQAEQQAAAMAAASEAEQQEWERAFKLFQTNNGITSPEQAEILNLPPDATVADIDIARMNAQTARINATKPAAVKPDTLGASDYKTNPDYAEEVSYIYSNPVTALREIQANATALIQKYGYDGYRALVELATPKE